MDYAALLLRVIIDTSASWIRMFIALGISVLISVLVGIYSATHQKAEKIILPVVDVLQTLPILAFFPVALAVFLVVLGTGLVGINAAIIFLIITSMLWNIILGVYESVKTIPLEFIELSEIYHFDRWTRLKKIYLPACMPRIIEQSILSWSIGLFYLVTSEIFSVGTSGHQAAYGIGVAFATYLAADGVAAYLIGIGVFIAFVVATRFLFFRPLENYSVRYMKSEARLPKHKYEIIALDWISNKMPKTPTILTMPLRGGVQSHIRRRRHMAAASVVRGNSGRIYQLAALAIAVAALCLLFSNPVVRSYEVTVLPALLASFIRVWGAFAVMLVIAIPLCVYLVFKTRRSSSYMLFFQIIASIPATILLPAIVVGLASYNLGPEVVAFVIFLLSGIWYIVFSIMASTRTISPGIFEVQKIFGVKGWNAWKNIYLKALLPGLITGAMTGIAAEWNASIVAEYFVSGSVTSQVSLGIGKLLDISVGPTGQQIGGLALMAVALLNLVVMILLVNTFVWKRLYKRVAKVYGG